MRIPRLFIAAASSTALLHGCGSQESSKAPEPVVVLEASVPDSAQIRAAETFALGIVGLRTASASPAQLGSIGLFPGSALPGLELYRVTPGGRTTQSYDLDGDGTAEELEIFVRQDDTAYLAWTAGDRCRLAFDTAGATWFFDVPCGADGGLVCRQGDVILCQLCDAEFCTTCEVEAGVATCGEIIPPEPDIVEDTTPEVGPDTGTDTPGEVEDPLDDDLIEEDPHADVDVDVLPDVEEDIESGPCDPACLSESGGICCTGCGCSASDCRPVCSDPDYTWDCEVQCCFNYDLLECFGE